MAIGSSVGEQIVQAICDALNGDANKPCVTYRTRIDAFTRKELPAFVLFSTKETVQTESSNTVLRKRTLRLECIVEAEPPADSIVDPLYCWALSVLDNCDALSPQNAKAMGLRRLEEASIQWEVVPSYQDACECWIDFDVVYATLAGDPTQKVVK